MSAGDDEVYGLLGLLAEIITDVFTDKSDQTHVVVSEYGRHKNIAVGSSEFENLVLKIGVGSTGIAPDRGVVETLRRTLRGMSSKVQVLHQRVARTPDGLVIDLGRSDWTAVEVTSSGWTVVNPEFPPFTRGATTGELPVPERDGSLDELEDFIPTDNPMDLALLKLWLPTGLVPDIARPLVVLTGHKGSGKSETSRLLQSLLDPQTIPGCHLPGTVRDLVVALRGQYVPHFDNVRNIPPTHGDVLSEAVTNFGSVVRELFTDGTGHVEAFRRTALISGLEVPTSAPDLLSRMILIEFRGSDKLSVIERLSEKFNSAKPRIVGALLDSLSLALRIRETMAPVCEVKHRLMDWIEWAVACGLAQGFTRESCIAAIQEMVNRQHLQVVAAQPIARAIIELTKLNATWRGTPTSLLSLVDPIGTQLNLRREPGWPRSVEALGKAVKSVAPELIELGIEVTWGQHGKYRERYFEITKLDATRPRATFRAIS